MATILYLTTEEKKTFDDLSAALKEGWTVEAESTKGFETDEQLWMRYQMSSLAKNPKAQALVDGMLAGKKPEQVSLSDFSEKDLQELLFTIGARGVTFLILAMLDGIGSDDDLMKLSQLTTIRHELLAINVSA